MRCGRSGRPAEDLPWYDRKFCNDLIPERSGGATGGLGRQVQRLAVRREGRLSIGVRAPA
eukprot:5320978-Alexandrium_andersonii.AAC.1